MNTPISFSVDPAAASSINKAIPASAVVLKLTDTDAAKMAAQQQNTITPGTSTTPGNSTVAPAVQPGANPTSKSKLYLYLGLAATAVVGGMLFLGKSKKAALAGVKPAAKAVKKAGRKAKKVSAAKKKDAVKAAKKAKRVAHKIASI